MQVPHHRSVRGRLTVVFSAGAIALLCAACSSSPKAADSSKPQVQAIAKTSELDRTTCVKHQTSQDGCGEYRVLSYDATWRNELGNQGRFVLERDGLTIRAHCGSESCGTWADSVGKTVIADKSIGDLITYYIPPCQSPGYVETALEMYKQRTGRSATVAQVCWDTLVVERIDARTTK
jgi:hypothetical protein